MKTIAVFIGGETQKRLKYFVDYSIIRAGRFVYNKTLHCFHGFKQANKYALRQAKKLHVKQLYLHDTSASFGRNVVTYYDLNVY